MFLSTVTANENSTNQSITTTDTYQTSDTYTNTNVSKEIENSENKIIKNSEKTQKHYTNTTLKTTNNTTHIILNASVKSDITVNGGYVIYKLNGVTLNNSSGEKYKVYVKDSTAVLTLPITQYRKVYCSSEAVYAGSSTFNASRYTNNNTLNTRINPTIKVTLNQSYYYGGEKVRLTITLSSKEQEKFSGIVIFKINGQTHRDSNNNTLSVKIFGNAVTAIYQIPKGLKANNLTITSISEGSRYNKVQTDNIVYLKPLKSVINVKKVGVDNNNYCIINAKVNDIYNKTIVGKNTLNVLVNNKKIVVNNNSRSYTIKNGDINLKIPLNYYSNGKYNIKLNMLGNNAYTSVNSSAYTINITDKYYTKVIIDTPQKAKNGSTLSIRAYVTYKDTSILKTINQGKIIININNKTLTSNIENGKAVISYKLPSTTGKYVIKASYEGVDNLRDSSSSKNITLTSGSISAQESAILGNKNPKTSSISLINNTPNLIYMTNYVWADENGTYTLTKSQYQEVLKQDSYSLYLNNYLSKYVAFKTQNESSIYHVLTREKWNVIEKYVNNYYVSKNTMTLPDNITVNLKGKSYTYSEVRDVQDTEYTCGPTATSVCTQSLRNYVNEDTLAKAFNTYKYTGTYAYYIPNAMKKYNMTATYYYQSSFDSALNQLAKGGCSLVFYGVNHYVSIIDINKDKTKVLVSNSYGNYSMGGGKIPNGWVNISFMKKRFSSDSFAGLIVKLNYSLSSTTKNNVNMLYNNFVPKWNRQNENEELV